MTRLTQAITTLTRLTSLSTRVLADVAVGTAFVQRPPSYTVPAFSGSVGVAGYFGGGYAPSLTSRIDKITFPADTKTTLSATLSSARSELSAMANSAVAGYFGGGYDGANISGIDKVSFPADTKTTLSATLTAGRSELGGMANSGVAGYFGGGDPATDIIDKVSFPADTKTTLSATITANVTSITGMANSGLL